MYKYEVLCVEEEKEMSQRRNKVAVMGYGKNKLQKKRLI